MTIYYKQGSMLKNWVEGLTDEACYPWQSPNFFVKPTIATEQNKILIDQYKVTCEFFKIIEKKLKLTLLNPSTLAHD